VTRLNSRLGKEAGYKQRVDVVLPNFPSSTWKLDKKKEVFAAVVKTMENEFVRLEPGDRGLVSLDTPYCEGCDGHCAVQTSTIHPLDIWSMKKGGGGKGIVPCMSRTVAGMPMFEVTTYFYVSNILDE
jgi:hypothetical protein